MVGADRVIYHNSCCRVMSAMLRFDLPLTRFHKTYIGKQPLACRPDPQGPVGKQQRSTWRIHQGSERFVVSCLISRYLSVKTTNTLAVVFGIPNNTSSFASRRTTHSCTTVPSVIVKKVNDCWVERHSLLCACATGTCHQTGGLRLGC